MIQPLRSGDDPISGDSGSVFNNGYALSDEFIKEGGFTDVWPPHHRNDWFHIFCQAQNRLPIDSGVRSAFLLSLYFYFKLR